MLPEPLSAWVKPYAAMAREEELHWRSLDEITKAAKALLGALDATWAPTTWVWEAPHQLSTEIDSN